MGGEVLGLREGVKESFGRVPHQIWRNTPEGQDPLSGAPMGEETG